MHVHTRVYMQGMHLVPSAYVYVAQRGGRTNRLIQMCLLRAIQGLGVSGSRLPDGASILRFLSIESCPRARDSSRSADRQNGVHAMRAIAFGMVLRVCFCLLGGKDMRV